MKNKAIKKVLAVGMSALLFAATGVPTTVQAAGWKQNTTGWWWQEDDGSYPGGMPGKRSRSDRDRFKFCKSG